MEYGIEKCAMRVMKRGKRHMTDGMELPNHDKIRTFGENETYKYLGILEVDTIKQVEMKDKIRKKYLRRQVNYSRQNYVSRKEGGRGLARIENSVVLTIQRLKDYIEKHERWLITAIRYNTDNTIDDRMTTTRKQNGRKNNSMAALKD